MPSSQIYRIDEHDKKTFPESSAQNSSQGKYKGMIDTSGEAAGGGYCGAACCGSGRYTTDIFFLIMIFAMWTAMSIMGGIAVQTGNPYRLLAPMNDVGSICGQSPSVINQPYLYQVSPLGLGTCVSSCPSTAASSSTSLSRSDYVCLNWVSNSTLYGFTNPNGGTAFSISQNAAWTLYLRTACMDSTGSFIIPTSVTSNPACGCMINLATTNAFYRCQYNNPTVQSNFNQALPDYFTAFMADIITARYVIFAFGFLLAILLALFFSHLLRFETVGLVVVWTGILLTVVLMIVATGVCWWRATQWQAESPQVHSTNARLALQVFSIVFLVITILFMCACIFLRRSINLAIKVVALAATALESMLLLIFTPLLNVTGLAVFLVPCLLYAFNVASNGSFTTQYYTYTNPITKIATQIPIGMTYSLDSTTAGEQLWFLFFCFLWTANFIAGIGSLVIAVAVATWYFTPFDQRSGVGSQTVCWAYGTVLRFHMGTAAFGGLIIALVQFARWVALYVEKHCKSVQGNPVARVIFCCVDCCLCCLEKCLKFVSKQAYIQTAIHGSNFCTGAKDAFFTIARNIFSIGAVSVISGVALVVNKVVVVVVCGISYYLFVQNYYPLQMYDSIATTALVMIVAWLTASMFMEVFHMAIDTVLMCYITDSEQNEGVPQHAAQDLHSFLATYGQLREDHKPVNPSTDPLPGGGGGGGCCDCCENHHTDNNNNNGYDYPAMTPVNPTTLQQQQPPPPASGQPQRLQPIV